MRICIDARKLDDFGIGTYIRNLLAGLAQIDSEFEYFVLVSDKAVAQIEPLGDRFHPVVENAPGYSLRELMAVSSQLRRLRPDLFHATHYVLPARLPCPTVVTLHDIIHLLYPQFLPNRFARLYARLMIRRSLRLARRAIAVSNNTKQDLKSFFAVEGENIRVVQNGVEEAFTKRLEETEIATRLESLGLRRPYLLFVGNPKPHKNLDNVVRAWRRALEITPCEALLACVGDREESAGRLRPLIEELELTDRVVFLGHVPQETLVALYQGASLFVFPSLYEGSALSVLEAMAAGVPVVTSSTSALGEIAEGYAETVNPLDIEGIAQAIARCLDSPSHRESLVKRGLERAADFTWTKTAERTLQVYREALEEP